MLPVSGLSGSSEEHARLRNIVRQLHLIDGIHAHATAGRWNQAASLAEGLNGVGARLTEGRQTVIIARSLKGDLTAARGMLAQTVGAEPWESHVAACLTVLCSPATEADTAVSAMTRQFLAAEPAPGCILFWTRLGLTIAALADRTRRPQRAKAVIRAAAEAAIQAADGYAARDIIQSPAAALMLEEQDRNRLAELATASGLGCGTLPAELLGPFTDAVTAALATQARQLAALTRRSRRS